MRDPDEKPVEPREDREWNRFAEDDFDYNQFYQGEYGRFTVSEDVDE